MRYLEARIAGRKLAEECFALIESEVKQAVFPDSGGHLDEAFWETMHRLVAAKLPPMVKPLREPIQPMNDQQAAAFREEVMPFGKWKGERVGWMMREEARYLLFLADAPNYFQQQLKRFLANPEIKRLTQPEDDGNA